MYDGWYASPIGRRVLEVEAQCVKATLSPTARPWVDVGCGSGRLGELLAVELGLDPAPNLLRLARTRLRNAVRGVAEQLPLADGSIGAAMAVTVVEFLTDPKPAFREIRRVLAPGGAFALGFLPAKGAWAARYRAEGKRGDEVFRAARFYTEGDLVALAGEVGFPVREVCSALFDAPHVVPSLRREQVATPDAGFMVLRLEAVG